MNLGRVRQRRDLRPTSTIMRQLWTWSAIALAIAAILPTTSVRAQARTWTIARAASRAIEESPEVRAAESELTIAGAHREHAAMPVIGNPVIGVRALVGWPDSAAATYGISIGVPFELSPRQSLRTSEADHRIDEAQARLDAARNEMRARAIRAVVELAAAQELLALAEQRLANAQELQGTVSTRASVGDATALDVALAEQEVAMASAAAVAQQRRLEVARNELRQVLDLDPDEEVVAAELDPDVWSNELTIDEVLARAAEQRREAAAWRSLSRRMRVTEDRLFAETVPPLFVSLEYEMQSNDQRNQSVGVGAQLGLPFWWTAQGERGIARAESVAATYAAERTDRSIAREAAGALRTVELAASELRQLDSEAVPAAERALSLIDELLAAGSVEIFRALSARRDVFDLRVRRVEALRDAWIARTELERAIGGPIE